MIRNFILFFIIIVIGWYGLNYILDKKGIGFQNVDKKYTVQLNANQFIDSTLTMSKDDKYVLSLCGTSTGQYEIISDIYNFRQESRVEDTDHDCTADEKQVINQMRGKYRTHKQDDGSLMLENDNNYQLYLIPSK